MVLDMLDPESLSDGWNAQFDDATERRYYVHAASDRVVWEHPNIEYYRGIVFMEKGGLAQMMENVESDPPSADDVAEMAAYLGITESDDALVKEVALFECCAPLPPSYTEVETSSGDVLYRCGAMCTHVLQDVHISMASTGSRQVMPSSMRARSSGLDTRLIA